MDTESGNIAPGNDPVVVPELGSEMAAGVKWRRTSSGMGALRCFTNIIPYGGLLSTTFNLASATLGGGVISLAAGFQMSGVAFSIILLVLVDGVHCLFGRSDDAGCGDDRL
ncbi:amino acid transporter, putative [Trypanosoma cruzi]|nr:amino acid transporter, putative [Trypanosoma cruzi]